jgi:hypothetical protein
VKTFFESLKIDRSGDRAILTATVPPGFIKKVLTESPVNSPAPGEEIKAPPNSRKKSKAR